MSNGHPLLRISKLAKSYGAVVALKEANFVVQPGEIHALLGANGAGKSTLVKILTGVIARDTGIIELDGTSINFTSPDNSRKSGVAPVFQDPALIPDLSLRRNLKLTHTNELRLLEELSKFEISINLDEVVNRIELPILRMIDLARALAHDPRLLILDEITAALPIDMAEKVVKTMGEEKAKGNSVIFISHRLAEIEQVCDYATVLRDGIDVDSFLASSGSEERIVAAMLGDKALVQASKSFVQRTSQESVLMAKSISFGRHLKDVSLSLNKGEVVGLVALEGQGQDALFEILAGEIQPDGGEIAVHGRAVRFKHPSDAISCGISYVPGDRKTALLPQRSIRENLAITKFRTLKSWRPINQGLEDSMVNKAVSDLEIDTRARSQVMHLSGGNQQKVTIGRWITTGFDVLLCFDPTRGIDVGTKGQIYKLLRNLANEGKSVLLFTSELREIQATCDRAIVLYEGKIHQELPYEMCDEEMLLNSAHGRSVL